MRRILTRSDQFLSTVQYSRWLMYSYDLRLDGYTVTEMEHTDTEM